MKTLMLGLLALLVVSTGCGRSKSAPGKAAPVAIDRNRLLAQLRSDHDLYAQAWNNKDFDAISSMWAHDPDITMWDATVRERIQGWDGPNGVEAWYRRAFDSMNDIDFHIRDLMIKIAGNGDCAIFTLYVENTFTDNQGNRKTVNPRVTVVKELRNGEWKIIHGDASYGVSEMVK